MKNMILIMLCVLLQACASWKEVQSPCTYDDRKGCGELIYSNDHQLT